MVNGTLKCNALALFEGSFNILASKLTVKAAFVDTNTGHTHGWTTGEGTIWSKATMDAMTALKESIELDLAKLHFTDGGTIAEPTAKTEGPAGSGGIGEHLGEQGEDAPPL